MSRDGSSSLRRSLRARWVLVAVIGVFVFADAAFLPAEKEIGAGPFNYYGLLVVQGHVPYRDFAMEYPPGSLVPIVVPALVPGPTKTTSFRAFQTLCGCLLVVLTAFLLRRYATRDLVIGVGLVAAIPLLLGPLVYFRYDLWPALLVTASLVCLEGRAQSRLGGALVGAATAAKLYAAALLLPMALANQRGRPGGARRSVTWAVVVFLAFLVPFVVLAPHGLASSFRGQFGRDLQIESTGGSAVAFLSMIGVLHGHAEFSSGSWNVAGPGVQVVGFVSSALGVVALLTLWVILFRRRNFQPPAALTYAACVATVLVFTKVLSPQFLVWLIPLAGLIRGRWGLTISVLVAVAMALSQQIYPIRYDELVVFQPATVTLLAVRNLLLLTVAALIWSLLVATREPR